MPPINVPPLDYSSRDQEAIRADLIRAIPYYTPDWTDNNPTDPGIVLLTLLAGGLDVLHFYVDRMAAEAFLPTAVKRESIVKLLRLIGFELRSVVPASADVTFTLAPISAAVTVPAGTKVQTVASENQEPVVYETDADLVFAAGETTGTVSVVEGQAGDEDLGESNGTAYQPFEIEAVIIVEGSLEIFVDEGAGEVLWTAVTSFVDSGPTDTVYRAERNADDTVTIFFGDNLQGKIPAATSSIRAAFRLITGDRGGVFGNVGAGKITTLVGTVLSDAGTGVTFEVTNPLQASGGEDRQSEEEAKRLGPASLLALNRAVTPSDYKTLAEQFGGVAKAKVIQGTSNDACCACNIDLYIAPTGGGTASTALKDDLLDYFDDKKMVGTCIEIKDPTYVAVDLGGTTFIASNVNFQDTQDLVNTTIAEFFSLDGEFADFGSDMYLGNLFAALENVDGVDHVDLDNAYRRPVPVLETWQGDTAFSAITPGTTAVDETWTVTFLSPTTFSVQGSVSGLQQDGTVGTPYISDGGEISFTLTAGSTPNQIGDLATFLTSKFFGNVPISPTEIMEQGTVTMSFAVVPASGAASSC
jgi:baseplate J-like protein